MEIRIDERDAFSCLGVRHAGNLAEHYSSSYDEWQDDERDTSEPLRDATLANLNFRLVEVVMMFLLPLLAVALAIPPKRSTSALGVFVAIVMVVAYHKINQYGEGVAELGRVNPYLALWGPFAVFAAIIVWMYHRVAHVPGGQAIGALETFYGKISKKIARLMKRGQPRVEQEAVADAV